jgi:hypothetical protein
MGRLGNRSISFTAESEARPQGAISFYAVREPLNKCITREITATSSNRWINPPATWNANHETPQIARKMKNKTRKIKSRITLHAP